MNKESWKNKTIFFLFEWIQKVDLPRGVAKKGVRIGGGGGDIGEYYNYNADRLD
jgi:hypothetical protein